jgi:DMSO/TMAO reductase YedYZ molybdopterin-dependent catalytic subunit
MVRANARTPEQGGSHGRRRVSFGFPPRLRVATKLGCKSPKQIAAIEVSNRYPGGYWEDRRYDWFSGI